MAFEGICPFYLIHASSFATFVGLDIVDGGYNGHFIYHRFHQTGERYSLTGLLIEKILNLLSSVSVEI